MSKKNIMILLGVAAVVVALIGCKKCKSRCGGSEAAV